MIEQRCKKALILQTVAEIIQIFYSSRLNKETFVLKYGR